MSEHRIPTAGLHQWVVDLWLAAGSDAREARLTADHLVGANLTGHAAIEIGSHVALHCGIEASRRAGAAVGEAFGDESGGLLSHGVRFAKLFAISPERGADTIVYLASSDEVAGITGGYFYKNRPATPSPEAQDDDDAHRLWDETARLIGLERPADMG